MDKKEEFKLFVKQNPILTKYIKNGTMTWQKFYEIYDIYGSDNTAWDIYLNNTPTTLTNNDILGFLKNIDLDSIQNGVNSIQRVLGVFQDLASNNTSKTEYKPRPTYKHFED
ncbi:MAG: hypothetical protein IJZ36_00810 [Bacilli bacterium]|nr:hypothetical protein [Bacilli bacterium]